MGLYTVFLPFTISKILTIWGSEHHLLRSEEKTMGFRLTKPSLSSFYLLVFLILLPLKFCLRNSEFKNRGSRIRLDLFSPRFNFSDKHGGAKFDFDFIFLRTYIFPLPLSVTLIFKFIEISHHNNVGIAFALRLFFFCLMHWSRLKCQHVNDCVLSEF